MVTLNKSITICMLARDCGSSVRRNIPKIEKLRQLFTTSYVIVVENDSKDDTKIVLEKWKNSSKNIFIISKDTNTVTIPPKRNNLVNPNASLYRNEKMAGFRNQYLNFIRDNNIITDYIIVIDIDIYDFEPDTLVKSIVDAPRDWAALFANGRLFCKFFGKKILLHYYDLFAYVDIDSIVYDKMPYEMYIDADKLEKKLKKNQFVKCKSAGGGLIIYKYNSIINSCYSTKKNTRSVFNEALCEHISVNKSVASYGQLYICKQMVVLYEEIWNILQIISNFIKHTTFLKINSLLRHKKCPV